MKRAYVKPVMESEAFVANEYVAACYTIGCTNGGSAKVKAVSEDAIGIIEHDGENIYQGAMTNCNYCCDDKHVESPWEVRLINLIIAGINALIPGTNNDLDYIDVGGFEPHHIITSVKPGHVDANGKNHIPASI